MALYAFDGTWNKPDYADDGSDRNTNVIKFAEQYANAKVHDAAGELLHLKSEYANGVGNRFRRAGKIVGGLTGA